MRSLRTALGVATGGLLYYLFLATVEVFSKVNYGVLFGTWTLWPVLEYLPFVIVLRLFGLRPGARIAGTVYVVIIDMATLFVGVWGMEGLEAAPGVFLGALPVLSIIILIVLSAVPIRANREHGGAKGQQ